MNGHDMLLSAMKLLILLAAATGLFESHEDIGVNPKAGGVEFAGGEYRVTGGGANIWGAESRATSPSRPTSASLARELKRTARRCS